MQEKDNIFADVLAESLNGETKTYNFCKCLKLANITHLHIKRRKDNKDPVSILPTLSKVLERIPFKLISVYFDKFLSDQQCGFWKRYSTQHCLLNLEKGKSSVNKGKYFGTLLTDLSKGFHCLNH